MNKLINELQRRNVIKAAISYAVIGWAILQVVDILFPAFDIPDSAIKYILYALIGLFPIWVVFAYIYEWTPSGFKKTTEVAEEASVYRQTGKRLNMMIITGLSLVVLLLIVDRIFNFTGSVSNEDQQSKTIAVLPFENMSSDDESWFAKGVTEDILTHISKIGDLRVLSNFTLRDYDTKGKTVEEIGKELGVGYLLTGSIRRAGEQLRITCQLVQVNPEEQTWAENFDKRMDDVFAIQTQVATEVAQRLKVKLTNQETELIKAWPTKNLEAYDLYLKGYAYYTNGNAEDNQKAIDLYKRALALDEHFIEPYLGLISAYSKQIANYGSKPQTFFDSLYVMAKRATELAPNSADAWEELAYQHLVKGDYDQGIALSRKALSLNPNNTGSLNVLGLLLRNDGKLDEAIPLFEKANMLEPLRSNVYNYNIGMSYLFLDMQEEAEKYLQSVIHSGKSLEISYTLLGEIYRPSGKKDKIRECINEILKLDENTKNYDRAVNLAFFGEFDDLIIKEYVSKVLASEEYNNLDHYSTTIALCYLLKKDNKLDSMNNILDKYERETREYFKDENSGDVAWAMTEIEMLRGNPKKALDYFEELVNLGATWGYVELKYNRLLRPLLNDPKYLKLADKMEKEMQRQRLNLSARKNNNIRL